MGNLVFQATLGGQVNLVGPNTASTYNINVPAVAGTMVTTGDTGTVTNTMLAGSIANNKLSNSSVTIGSTSIALGATSTTLDGVNIGATTAGTGKFTTLTSTSDATLNGLTVGKGAGASSSNTVVGAGALNSGSQSGGYNAAFGPSSLSANTSGNFNSAFNYALIANTTGSENSAFGTSALNANTTGSSNTAVGRSALLNNTTASNNTAVGYQAGYSVSTGNWNVFVGKQAGNSTTGSTNTFIGGGSGNLVTSGSSNSILGAYSGNQGGLDIRTANNYIVLSDGDGNPRGWWDNSGIFYANPTRMRINGNSIYDSASTGNNTGISFGAANIIPTDGAGAGVDNAKDLGSGTYRMRTIYAGTGTINTSDANTKQDVADLDDVEKRVAVRIKSLIKKFRFKDAVAEKGDAARIHVGAVAQEVAAAFVAEGLDPTRYALFCSDTWYEVDGKASSDKPYTAETPNAVAVTRLGLRYEELLAFVIAAL